MAFALAGAPNAVATCGTALADDHFQILKNLARKVVLAYDSDAAGQGAAEKWYQWEQRYEIQLEVADLPAGRDPADVWHDDPAALAARRSSAATPFLQFRLDRVLAAADLATLEGRARAAEAGAAIVARAPERPRARPVRHEARGRARHRRRPAARRGGAAPRGAGDGRVAQRAPRPTAVARRDAGACRRARRPARGRRAAVRGARAGARRRLARRARCSPIRSRARAFEAIASTPTTSTTRSTQTDGPVRDLLERVAVEEPDRDRRARNAARPTDGEHRRTRGAARASPGCYAPATNARVGEGAARRARARAEGRRLGRGAAATQPSC